MQKTSKDVVSQKQGFVSVTVAFGHINEWESAYVESSRTRNCTYVGRTDQTTRAFMIMKANGKSTAIAQQWLAWNEGENSHLAFYWVTDQNVAIQDENIKWYFEGQIYSIYDLPRVVNFEGTGAVRMHVAGVAPLATLALRNQELCKAYRSMSMLVNEPILWVPRTNIINQKDFIMECLFRHLCAGVGSSKSPVYFQMRQLMEREFGMSPWEMYLAAGCKTEIMCYDVFRKKGMIAKCYKILDALIETPLEMLGVSINVAKKWLKTKDFIKLSTYMPWWFANDDSPYKVPEVEDTYITAKRVESTFTSSRSFIPARELGYDTGSKSFDKADNTIVEMKTPMQIPPDVIREPALETQNIQS